MGTVKERTCEEYLLHATGAFTPERVNLGVLGAKPWQRPEQPVGRERQRKPIEEKESKDARGKADRTKGAEVKFPLPKGSVAV